MKKAVLPMFLLSLVSLLTMPAIGQDKEPRIISRSRELFENTNCIATNTCDLKQIRYLAEDYEIMVDGGYHYGTRLFAWYITETVENLENYAFVQFIKGCQYQSTDNNNTTWVARDYFLERILFKHKNWVIDSIDSDPVYYSTPNSRHFNYKQDEEKTYGANKPTLPELYITDRPGTAFYISPTAKNISLAFKTCLYRTSDVPIKTTPDNINFAEPISCFYWSSSWVYNHDKDKFENPPQISPVCDKPDD
ncbi:MAG: hypothetical protein A2918_01375 [Candidatus Yanofskybacteria bacterium RIFCSPLOWO2_01_FULL_42_49]|uniref:Uncharacterized protein n=1 Tax=Candidatus Yanofskybacteria bacterium RIFCSPLOWO2_01_FULL_42_49 TaxID=1802694 RepID=A0A1F8GBW6_9BACT|nr:MAG: hypothetical protein A2918_01375 [Candidatus Yanofskybacteria bacterium RIFCSPLOWO2_01_FULL_42_49]